ncbi:MAG: hypothetical protein KZQ66_03960 [Candidatus Thiodiazotropha sp. (ex Lucinoma aequizonata)]|nr:hypothetical protein [Candidatus Thiodiazotropha sp. (ex Lucinoma aequizonata)]MCU7893631.1 hypothetical protein [Candidatus Thiodiazotropha sp. (ex Lucinoma aequizonata)]MCU7899398.1 hypothetical protein [Candidatus Thiodiazotropha sp. (ex Lucinoma aequizonata)]MCU7901258.1 hypothetical protein [Candidatus Thiodiazotropha sp. (ex Lucinoma aequizonata)]MCU7909879.1 hypothetical protein [Candidatus Thiodiazotropha sp. (ex Lucinoma aequizonata)]
MASLTDFLLPCFRLIYGLESTPAEVVYPAMPVIIKTPLHPIVIAAPDPKAEGNWETKQTNEGTRCLFHGVGDDLLGFVISGRFLEEKQVLSQRLPPLLPASI